LICRNIHGSAAAAIRQKEIGAVARRSAPAEIGRAPRAREFVNLASSKRNLFDLIKAGLAFLSFGEMW